MACEEEKYAAAASLDILLTEYEFFFCLFFLSTRENRR